MTLGTWALAALCAGALGWLGPHVIARLPASPDAEGDAPTYQELSEIPRLDAWLALGAVVLVSIVAFAVPWYLLPAWVVVCGVGIWLAYIDARTRLLPTRIVWPLYALVLLAVGAEAAFTGDLSLLVRALMASAIAFGVFWLFWWFGGFFRGGGFGYGDVRFSAPLGVALGSVGGWAAAVGLYAGILIGGVVGIALKASGRNDAFALGPCLLLGAVAAPSLIKVL